MPHQLSSTSPSIHIIQPRFSISTCRHNLRPCGVEADIKHLILRPKKSVDTLPGGDIPDLAGPVDAACCAVLPRELELSRRNFSFMLL